MYLHVEMFMHMEDQIINYLLNQNVDYFIYILLFLIIFYSFNFMSRKISMYI